MGKGGGSQGGGGHGASDEGVLVVHGPSPGPLGPIPHIFLLILVFLVRAPGVSSSGRWVGGRRQPGGAMGGVQLCRDRGGG